MAGPIIAFTENIFGNLDPALGALARLNPTIRMSKSTSADDILAVAKDADAILVTYAKLPRELLLQLTNCKAIGRFGLGVDNIDLPTCKEKGIAVNYVPDYCIHEVSDHTVALLLSLIRKIPLANSLVQAGRWEMPAVVPITRIKGTVLGLLGFGHIPRLVVPKAKAFGIEVIAYDPFCDKKLFEQTGVESVDLDTLYKRCDYLSVHAPHTPQTRGMVNAEAFAKMKKGVYIVNTARGPLIDEPALIAALEAGVIAGAGLDVFDQEPLPADHPLRRLPNTVVTPHIGGRTRENFIARYKDSLEDVQAWLAGKPVRVLGA